MSTSEDHAQRIFGNEISRRAYAKARRSKDKFVKRFGDDSQAVYHLQAQGLPVIGERLGVRNLVMATDDVALDLHADAQAQPRPSHTDRTVAGSAGRPVVVGNIRMGFGHYRISMAMASAAHAMGYTPYWFDLASFANTTGSQMISSPSLAFSTTTL